MSDIHLCTEMPTPEEKEQEALAAAVNERADNAAGGGPEGAASIPMPVELVVVNTKMWQPGRTLRVSTAPARQIRCDAGRPVRFPVLGL